MANFFNFEDIGDNITLLKFRNESFELDTNRLKKTLEKKPEISKLASKLYTFDDKNLYFENIYHQALQIEIGKEISKKLDEIDPENGWRKFSFLTDRAGVLERQKASAVYYLFLMAMEYLNILDKFLESHKEEIEKVFKRGKESKERYNAKMKYLRGLPYRTSSDVMGGW